MDQTLEPIGRFERIRWVRSTGSTNADLVAELRAGDPAPGVLITDEQTAGRGRLGRTWHAPAGSALLLSAHVRWPALATAHLVPLALGVAAVEAADSVGRDVYLKWPNDLVTGADGKLGGMLTEVVGSESGPTDVVCGLGVNVSWPLEPIPDLPAATALDAQPGAPVDRERLAIALLERFDARLVAVSELGAGPLLERYRERSATIGRRVRAETGDRVVEGRATDVDDSGRLVVDVGTDLVTIDVADVIHLRPTSSAPD